MAEAEPAESAQSEQSVIVVITVSDDVEAALMLRVNNS